MNANRAKGANGRTKVETQVQRLTELMELKAGQTLLMKANRLIDTRAGDRANGANKTY